MDTKTVFTKTARGLMEVAGKTRALSRAMRGPLKVIDGKLTVAQLKYKLGRMPQTELNEALQTLVDGDFIREFPHVVPSAPPLRKPVDSAEPAIDLDFTKPACTIPAITAKAVEAALQDAQAATDAAVARAKAEAESEARVRSLAEGRARKEAEERARREADDLRAKLEEERRARELAERRARNDAELARKQAEEKARRQADALRAELEHERKAREEAERRARHEAERLRKEAEEIARRDAEERACREAEQRARAEDEARVETEARLRREAEQAERKLREEAERKAREESEREHRQAEEMARREAEALRVELEGERKAREEAERKAQVEAERRSREEAERNARELAERTRRETEETAQRAAEEQARREAEQRARMEEQARIEEEARLRREAEQDERKAREESERERRQAEETARREAEALRAALEEERRAREKAERRAQEEAECKAREEAERGAREEAERKAWEEAERERRQAEEEARHEAEELRASLEQEREAREQAERKAQEEAERRSKVEAERREQERREQARGEAEEAARREAEERARAEADQHARADERARIDAEMRAQREAQETARDEANVQAARADEERRRESEQARNDERLPQTSDEQVLTYAWERPEARALLEAQDAETERYFAEMERELASEQAAAEQEPPEPRIVEHSRWRWKEQTGDGVQAGFKKWADAAGLALQPSTAVHRRLRKWRKPAALGLLLFIVLGLVLVHFISFEAHIPQFEKRAGAFLQQPVKIKALHLSLLPQPHWHLDGVAVGNAGQLTVAAVDAIPELSSMFSDKMVFKSIELESPVLSGEGLLALLFGKPAPLAFQVAHISAKNAQLNTKSFALPALNADISVGEDGAWRKIALETPDRKTNLLFKPQGDGAQIEVETNAFSLPFHPSFNVQDFSAKGVVRRGELQFKELKGGIYDGYLYGTADLKWDAGWSLSGEVKVRAMDPSRFAPVLLQGGLLEGNAVYSTHASTYDALFAAPRLEGSFEIRKGTLLGVNLGRLLQGDAIGGRTVFSELTGNVLRDAGKTQLRRLRLRAGPVWAGGNADIDAENRLGGRFGVELRSPVAHVRGNLGVSGTLSEPRLSR